MALSVAQLRELVVRKWGMSVSSTWVGRFVRRNRGKLSTRACKALAEKRAGSVVFDGVVAFCEELSAFLQHYSFPPHAVFNFDETRVVQRGTKMTLSRVEAAGKAKANVRSTRNSTVATLLSFFSAYGGVLLSVYILKGRFGADGEAPVTYTMETAPSSTRGTWPQYYCWTETGFIDAETFKAVLANVAEVWIARNPGIPALLFGDQLASHRRAEFALGLGLFLFSLPKNSSHITQPLDEAPFSSLQATTHRNHKEAIVDGMLATTSTRVLLLMAAYAAERRAFSGPVVRGAFRRCGLWPFDPALMQANVRANLGMASSCETPEEAARSAAAAVIQAAQERAGAALARATSGRAVVQRGVLHSPFLLLEHHRKTQAEEAQERQEKAARRAARATRKAEKERERLEQVAVRELRRCRVCVAKVHRGGKAWKGCTCGAFWVCPPCAKTFQAGVTMAQHVEDCPGPAVQENSSSSEESNGSSGAESFA